MRVARRAALLLVLAGLAFFYYAGATEHARVVNTERTRADQSGYLWDAVAIYRARHDGPDTLIGERNRMPVYPWLLSWLYKPSMSPDEFFARAKVWNIRLSLVLLAALALIAWRMLPPLIATNFVLVVAFGYYVYKAGYAQVELLFYFLLFVTFLTCLRQLRTDAPKPTVMLATLGGTLAALSHLSKAAVLPFAGLFLLVCAARALAPLLQRDRYPRAMAVRLAVVRSAGTLVFLVSFLAVLSPYLLNSKKHFGHYFYNVNSTFYVWYDDWPAASMGTYRDGDGVGWPTTPPEKIPTLRKYLKEHTAAQIARRFGNGFTEMITVSYTRLWYFKYLLIYVVLGLLMITRAWRPFVVMVRREPAIFAFIALYGVVYLAAVAFYQPISGTSLRMLLAHVAPLLFAVSVLSARSPFRDVRWDVVGVTLTPTHAHLFILATIAFDVVFVHWTRLMSQFAGY
jgi:hypothetical protein